MCWILFFFGCVFLLFAGGGVAVCVCLVVFQFLAASRADSVPSAILRASGRLAPLHTDLYTRGRCAVEGGFPSPHSQ